jgi:hypothetical protein
VSVLKKMSPCFSKLCHPLRAPNNAKRKLLKGRRRAARLVPKPPSLDRGIGLGFGMPRKKNPQHLPPKCVHCDKVAADPHYVSEPKPDTDPALIHRVYDPRTFPVSIYHYCGNLVVVDTQRAALPAWARRP